MKVSVSLPGAALVKKPLGGGLRQSRGPKTDLESVSQVRAVNASPNASGPDNSGAWVMGFIILMVMSVGAYFWVNYSTPPTTSGETNISVAFPTSGNISSATTTSKATSNY